MTQWWGRLVSIISKRASGTSRSLASRSPPQRARWQQGLARLTLRDWRHSSRPRLQNWKRWSWKTSSWSNRYFYSFNSLKSISIIYRSSFYILQALNHTRVAEGSVREFEQVRLELFWKLCFKQFWLVFFSILSLMKVEKLPNFCPITFGVGV